MLVAMLLSVFAFEASAAYQPGQIIVKENFDGTSSYDYSTNLTGITATVKDGKLVFDVTTTAVNDSLYIFPFDPVKGVDSFTVTFDLYVISNDNTTATSVPFFAYGIGDGDKPDFLYGGWSYQNGTCHVGGRKSDFEGGVINRRYRTIYTDETHKDKLTRANTPTAEKYAITLEMTKTDYCNVLVNGKNHYKDAYSTEPLPTPWVEGKLGLVFRTRGMSFAIDNLMVYAGVGVSPITDTTANTTAANTTSASNTSATTTTSPGTYDFTVLLFAAFIGLSSVTVLLSKKSLKRILLDKR